MHINITQEMIEEARKKREQDNKLIQYALDDGADGDNICIACQ